MSICATVGRPVETRIDACIHDGFVVFDQPTVEQSFLYHLLAALEPTWSKRGQTGSQMNLNTGLLYGCLVPIPPTEVEQRAIAAALNDIDALLAGLDRLIAKKRDLKLAAMQQLLTGQTRLPGFQGEWEVKRLGEHVSFLKNGVHSRAELTTNGLIKNLHYGDIHACGGVTLDPSSMPSLESNRAHALGRLMDGDLVFVDASEDIDGVGKSVEIVGAAGVPFVAGLHTIAARFDPAVLAHGFKAYLQFCPPFRLHLRRLAAGTKVYATSRRHIASAEVPLPNFQEQTAIAGVLSDMDTELTTLEVRRDKTSALKQAMMQELLTGKTRLV
jgi:type I restriction enzyme S subunit